MFYAHNTGLPLHEPARLWWAELLNGTERVGVPWIVATGFVRLVTDPRILSDPARPEDAVDLMTAWFRSPAVIPLNPGTQYLAIFRNLLAAAGVGGNLATDAHIAALAIENQAEVHSNDSDFARFRGLRWRNPL